MLVKAIESEVEGHLKGGYTDEDLAFAIDIAKRIERAELFEDRDGDEIEEIRGRARALIEEAAVTYPAVRAYESPQDGAPCPKEVQVEIEERAKALAEAEEKEEEAVDDDG